MLHYSLPLYSFIIKVVVNAPSHTIGEGGGGGGGNSPIAPCASYATVIGIAVVKVIQWIRF